MLDFNIDLKFTPEIIFVPKGKVDRLVVSSCAIHLFSDKRIWSEFEEETYSYLNGNNWGLGVVDFEIGFAGYSGMAYPKVYTKCFVLRTDSNWRIKPMKFSNETSCSKVNQRGETIIGIRYHFRDEQEIERLTSSECLMFECFFALDNPKNVYGLMCQLRKSETGWEAEFANTYRLEHAKNIKYLMD